MVVVVLVIGKLTQIKQTQTPLPEASCQSYCPSIRRLKTGPEN